MIYHLPCSVTTLVRQKNKHVICTYECDTRETRACQTLWQVGFILIALTASSPLCIGKGGGAWLSGLYVCHHSLLLKRGRVLIGASKMPLASTHNTALSHSCTPTLPRITRNLQILVRNWLPPLPIASFWNPSSGGIIRWALVRTGSIIRQILTNN